MAEPCALGASVTCWLAERITPSIGRELSAAVDRLDARMARLAALQAAGAYVATNGCWHYDTRNLGSDTPQAARALFSQPTTGAQRKRLRAAIQQARGADGLLHWPIEGLKRT